MWSHCMVCTQSLGTNEAVEAFPIGRRLAFDAQKGRLWVVCRGCERWNLAPLEERWEAVEMCDRLFRESRLRASTPEIGLARIAEGLELVRIGAPAREEFAAWRYGDQFGRRRKQAMIKGIGIVSALSIAFMGGLVVGGAVGGMVLHSAQVANAYGQWRSIVRLRDPAGKLVKLREGHLSRVQLLRAEQEGSDFDLVIEHTNGSLRLSGPDAPPTARRLMALINRHGATERDIGDAVRRLEASGDPSAFLHEAMDAHAAPARYPTLGLTGKPLKRPRARELPGSLARMNAHTRLALEMALHEEGERRALEGELTLLTAAWKEAEAVAAIADGLAIPEATERDLQALKDPPT